MKVLVFAPHMDDEVLGVGGTIARHVSAGDQVTVCFVANRAYQHQYDDALIEREKDAARKAQSILGYQDVHFLDLPDERLDQRLQDLIIPMEEVYQSAQPDLVFVNHGGDLNQDHQAVYRAAVIACRPQAPHRLKGLYAYETPSSTDQAPSLAETVFLPVRYVNIEAHLDQKLKALACYEAESRIFPHPRSPEGVTVYAQKRGLEVGYPAAEGFVVLRELHE